MVWEIMLLSLRLLWRRLGLLLLANVLWLGLSLLILPWPAATVGLFALARRIVAEDLEADPRPATLADFWAGVRSYWRRGSLVGFGDLLCLALIVLALRFYGESASAPLSWLVGPLTLVWLAWAGAQLYLFPLLIERPGRSALAVGREAFLMAISYPVNTLSLLLTAAIITAGAVVLAGPILLIFFSFIAVLQTIALRSVLVRRGEIAAMVVTAEQRAARELLKR